MVLPPAKPDELPPMIAPLSPLLLKTSYPRELQRSPAFSRQAPQVLARPEQFSVKACCPFGPNVAEDEAHPATNAVANTAMIVFIFLLLVCTALSTKFRKTLGLEVSNIFSKLPAKPYAAVPISCAKY